LIPVRGTSRQEQHFGHISLLLTKSKLKQSKSQNNKRKNNQKLTANNSPLFILFIHKIMDAI
jgi:hypothetical protein